MNPPKLMDLFPAQPQKETDISPKELSPPNLVNTEKTRPPENIRPEGQVRHDVAPVSISPKASMQPTPELSLQPNQDILNKQHVSMLPIDELHPYQNHPFRPYTQEKLDELIESIRELGIFSPVQVRHRVAGGYEILSGHNRTEAARVLNHSTVPCIIIDASDTDAQLIVATANLNQRQDLFPSEKAYAYKMQMEALKNKEKRGAFEGLKSDNNNVGEEDCHSDNLPESSKTIYRYIRLTRLISPLLEFIDSGDLSILAGEQLSYLDSAEQTVVHEYFFINKKKKLDIKTATFIRKFAMTTKLTYQKLETMLEKPQKEKAPKKSSSTFSIPLSRVKAYLPLEKTPKEIEEYVIEALKEQWQKNQGADKKDEL